MERVEAERFQRLVSPEPSSGCWLWAGSMRADGYGLFWKNGKNRRAHRQAWRIFCGSIPEGGLILHKCDNPSCVNPDHLYSGTHADNSRDMVVRQRINRGERNGQSKLDLRSARKIKSLLGEGQLSQRKIGLLFGVSRSAVQQIKLGNNWRWA